MAEAETLGAAAIATLVLGSGGVIGFFRLLNEMRAQDRLERAERHSEFAEIRNEMRLDRREARAGRQEERTEYATFFATYDKSIASLKVQYDTESDQNHKQEIGKRLAELATEYRRQLEEYRNTIDIVESVDKGRVPVTPTPITDERRRELTEGLETSKGVRPALLTAIDFRALGNAAYQVGNYKDAVVAYTRSLQREGNDAITLNNRGVAFSHLNLYDEALAEYNRALEFQPDDPRILNNRGATLVNLNRYDEALAVYNHSLELQPHDPDTLNGRAATHLWLWQFTDALKDFNSSLALRPDDPNTLSTRGATFDRLQRYYKALADMNRSLELRPDHPYTLYTRAITFTRLKRYREALTDFKRAFQLESDDPKDVYTGARAFCLAGQLGQALQWLEQAISGMPAYRRFARDDEDFANLRSDPKLGPQFERLVAEPED